MKISISFLFLILLAAHPLTVAAAEPEVIYWNSDAGKALRARIAPDEDYWQLIPWFTEQVNQTYCGVASAVTVLNAMPIRKPVDPIYAPHAYFTQSNFFTPEVVKIISPQTVRNQGIGIKGAWLEYFSQTIFPGYSSPLMCTSPAEAIHASQSPIPDRRP